MPETFQCHLEPVRLKKVMRPKIIGLIHEDSSGILKFF